MPVYTIVHYSLFTLLYGNLFSFFIAFCNLLMHLFASLFEVQYKKSYTVYCFHLAGEADANTKKWLLPKFVCQTLFGPKGE